MIPRPFIALLMFGALALAGTPAQAATVTRGPYLQMGTPTTVVVRWRTDQPSASRVWYGADAASLDHNADAAEATTEHEVALSGLSSGTRYFYAIGSPDARLAGDATYRFATAPARGAAAPTRIWAIGDAGTGDAKQAAVRDAYLAYAKDRPADVWLMLGDNAYPKGTDADYQRTVFDVYALPMRQTALWSTVGNHDTDQKTDFRDDYPYFKIFTLPQHGEAGGLASGNEHYYSFDHGPVHFLCLDSMTAPRGPASAMLAWAKQDLAATKLPWIVAFWHHPPYSKGSHDSDKDRVATEFRRDVLPMLEDAGVDLVLSGHSHVYERSFLLHGHYGPSSSLTPEMKVDAGKGGEAAPYAKPQHDRGTVYVVAGSSGKTSGGPLNHPAMCVSLNQLGSMVIDIDGDHLKAGFLRESGAIADEFTIIKKP